jgi:hypothetical protein
MQGIRRLQFRCQMNPSVQAALALDGVIGEIGDERCRQHLGDGVSCAQAYFTDQGHAAAWNHNLIRQVNRNLSLIPIRFPKNLTYPIVFSF